MPLLVGGATLLCATIWLDLRLREQLATTDAMDLRTALSFSCLISLLFLSVWLTGEAGRHGVSDAAEIVLFLCLPMLLVSSCLLWFAAKVLKSRILRASLLIAFVLATDWAEQRFEATSGGDVIGRVFMLNSSLVALAITLRLCVWGAIEYSSSPKEGAS